MRFKESDSLGDFQQFISSIYAVSDDRSFSLWDLVSNVERFTMRAIKGIRKNDHNKLKYNLMISFSWLMAITNRLHIDGEETIWNRFPYCCSYCGRIPCLCKRIKPTRRKSNKANSKNKPRNFKEFQKMFGLIYSPSTRTLADSGIHLAEETGELSEAVHIFLGEHKDKQFTQLEEEIADYISCFFGVANSANIDIAEELAKLYYKNCHVCHHKPCTCKFSSIAIFSS